MSVFSKLTGEYHSTITTLTSGLGGGGDVLWTPSQVTTSAWFDADDFDTITESGGSVSKWDDKSGNLKHATQISGSSQPDYTASDSMIGGMASIGNSTNLGFLGLDVPSIEYEEIYCIGYYGDGTDALFGAFAVIIAGPGTNGNERIMGRSGQNDLISSSAFTIRAFKNGSLSDTAIILPLPATVMSFDRDSSGAVTQTTELLYTSLNTDRSWVGAFGEMVFVPSALSSTDREKMFGSLAWKWDGGVSGPLVADLDASNPYKLAPPLV